MPPKEPSEKTKEPLKSRSGDFNLLQKVVNGAIAGMVGVAIVFPLDLVKTRLQNQYVGPGGVKQYKSLFDCFKKTYAAEGFLGMYHGVGVNITLISPEKAFKLTTNDFFRYHFTKEDGSLPLSRQMVAGGLAGVAQASVSCPMELLKIQMQDAGRIVGEAESAGKSVMNMSSYQLTVKLFKERGITGLYKGAGATVVRDVFFNAMYFPIFAAINDMGPDDPGYRPPFWWSFVAGCGAGSVSALALTPMDVVKTRLQTINKGGHDRNYSSAMDCIRQTWKYEGARAFFKGGACRVIVIAPLYGIVQAVYFVGIAENYLGIK